MKKFWQQTQKVLVDLEYQLQCAICHKLPVNPYILWCKHSYCKECISNLKNCPECNFFIVNQELVPNIILKQILSLIAVTSEAINSNGFKCEFFQDSNQQLNTKQKSSNTIIHSAFRQSTNAMESFGKSACIEMNSKQVLKRSLRDVPCLLDKNETSATNCNTKKKAYCTTNSSKKSQKANLALSFKKSPKHKLYFAKKTSESDKVNKRGETPLHIACRRGKIKLVQQLIEEGAQPNVKDYANWTPLCDAVSLGNIAVVKALLQAGAAVNTPCHENTTPLIEAVIRKNEDMVSLLLSYGADIHQRTALNNTAWSLANDKLKAIMDNMNTVPIMKHPIIKVSPKAVTVHNLPEQHFDVVKSFCENFNLTLSTIFTDETTHLVVQKTSDNTCEESTSVLQAILCGCSVVGVDWIEACIQTGNLVSVDDYEPFGTEDLPHSSVFFKARKNREQMLPKLFDGCHISLQHGQLWPTRVKEELVTLVRASGAQYLTRECDPERIPPNELTVMFHISPNSALARLSHVILYQPASSSNHITYNMAHVKSLPTSWFKQCIKTFSVNL